VKLRHEYKHYINTVDYLIIKSRLSCLLKQDKHAGRNGQYKIRSLYFDNLYDKALLEKINGLNRREKFRIRFYNDDPSFIRLEKKSKTNGLCSKEKERISKDDCELLLKGNIDFLKESNKSLFHELYVKMKGQLLCPKTIVDYIREAYIYPVGNVRITFDKSIKTGLNATEMFNDNLPMLETINGRFIILEVKYDQFLPEVISDMLQTNERKAESISKYALCRSYD
jgi:hypothetical protein